MKENQISGFKKFLVISFAVLGVASVFGVLILLFHPFFVGQFSSIDQSVTAVVTESQSKYVVAVTESGPSGTVTRRFDANASSYHLDFGTSLDSSSIEFHPFADSPDHYLFTSGCRTIVLRKQTWLSTLVGHHPYIASIFVLVVVLGTMFTVLEHRALVEPTIIYPTWLSFFAAFFLCTVVLVAAGEARIYDYNGNPVNTVARTILLVVEFMLDIEHETLLLFGILCVFVLPQIFAYVMSGANGAARRPRFIRIAWRYAALLMAKSFIGASAVAMSLTFVGSYYGWLDSGPRTVISNLLAEILLLLYGFVFLALIPVSTRTRSRSLTDRGRSAVVRFHRVMIRRLYQTKSRSLHRAGSEAEAPAAPGAAK